jgi:hypothetical protein
VRRLRWLAVGAAAVVVVAAVAVAASTQQDGGTRSPQRPPATARPAGDRPVAVGALALRPDDVEATDLTRYGVVILNAWEHERAAAVKRAQPATEVLVYKDMASTRSYAVGADGTDDELLPTGVGYAAADAERREWFLRDERGERVEWSGYDGHWWMDVGSESYADAWLESVRAEVEANGWDGVMIDNAIVDPRVYLDDDARLAEYPTAGSYQAATERFLRRVTPALRDAGASVVVNLGGATPPIDLYERWATIAGGIMREHFAEVAGDDWARQLAQQDAASDAGARYFAVSYAKPSDEQFLTYARASFLIGWDGDPDDALLVASTDPDADPWSAAWTADVGTPVEERKRAGDAWVRRFSEGTVAVNPTDRVVSIDEPERIALPPRSGIVLRRGS